MQVVELALPGLLKISLQHFADQRGQFVETWQAARYRALGLPDFVQDNLVHSHHNVLRGLHFQRHQPQGKLIQVLVGEVWDLALDLRADSPTRGRHQLIRLCADDHCQLYIPPGFAHGYWVASAQALVSYKCTQAYLPDQQAGLRWDDPALAIRWPFKQPPLVNARDAAWPLT